MDKPEDDIDYSVPGRGQEDCSAGKDAAQKPGWKKRAGRLVIWSSIALAGGLGAMYANDRYNITDRISETFGSATHTIEDTVDTTKNRIKDALTTTPDEARDKLKDIIARHPDTNILEVVGPLYNLVPEDVRIQNAVELLKSAQADNKPGYVSQITSDASIETIMQTRKYLNDELGKYKIDALRADIKTLDSESKNSLESHIWGELKPKYQFNAIMQRSKQLEPVKKAQLIVINYETLDKGTSQDVFYECDNISEKKFSDRSERTYNMFKKDMKGKVDKLRRFFDHKYEQGKDTYDKSKELIQKGVKLMN